MAKMQQPEGTPLNGQLRRYSSSGSPSSLFFVPTSSLVLTPHFASPALKHPLQNGTKRPPSPQLPPPEPALATIFSSPPKPPLEPTPPKQPTAIIKHRAFSLTLPPNSMPSPIHRTRPRPPLPTAAPALYHQINKPPRQNSSSRLPLPPKAVSSISSTSHLAHPLLRALSPLSPRVKLSRSKPHTSHKSANSKRSSADAKSRSPASAARSRRARAAARL